MQPRTTSNFCNRLQYVSSLLSSPLLLLSRFLFEIDENLNAGFAMSVDKLVGVLVFFEGEAVARSEEHTSELQSH